MPDMLAHPNWEAWLTGFPSSTPPSQVIENLLNWLLERTGAETAFVVLPDPSGDWVDIAYTQGTSAESLQNLRLRPQETFLEATLTLGTEWWYTAPQNPAHPISLRKPASGIHNGLAVPLPGILFSAVGLLNRPEPFTEEELQILHSLAPALSLLVHGQDTYARMQIQSRLLDWLAQLPHQIGTDLSLQNALETITSVMRALGSAGGGIWLYNEERTVLLNATYFGVCPLPNTLLEVQLPPHWSHQICDLLHEGRTIALTPLKLSTQKVLGFVALTLPLQEPQLIEWLTTIGGHFALIIHHAILYEQTARQAQQGNTLYALSLKLGETYTPLEVLNQVVLTARDLVPHDVAVVYLPDPHNAARLIPTVVMPANDSLWHHFPHREYSLPGYVYTYATPVSTPELTENPHNRKEPLPSKFISALVVPLQVEDHCYGVLMLLTESPRDFSLSEVQLLFTLANTGALRWHDLQQRLHA